MSKISKVVFIQESWQALYDKYFAHLNFTVPVLVQVSGRWTEPVAQGLTCDLVYDAWPFNKWKSCDGSIDTQLDMTREARKVSDGSYLVQVANGIEPDAQYLGKSTNAINSQGLIWTTLLERMLLELMYYEQTDKHLDVEDITFCSGSLYLHGSIPSVYFGNSQVIVGTYNNNAPTIRKYSGRRVYVSTP
jgi:hypothetical protein